MPSKKVTTQSEKVMDVASPGKGKIMATSRPIIAQVASNSDDAKEPISDMKPAAAPSTTHKVIQPLSVNKDSNEPQLGVDGEQLDNVENDEIEETLKVEVKAAQGKEAVVEEQIPVKKPLAIRISDADAEVKDDEIDQGKVDDSSEASIDVNASQEDAKEEFENDEEHSIDSSNSESAGVDELAKKVETKRDAVKKAEEAAQKQAELQKLIDSKQYFVPIGNAAAHTSGSTMRAFLILLLLTAIVAGAYLALDAGLVEAPVELPFDLIPD